MHEQTRRRRDFLGPVQVLGLAGLSAIGAELLAAYADNTGNVGGIMFALVFFAALYGAPALLARELVRRAGWGWPSMLLLTLALGIAQACLIDQSLFSDDYQGYEGWTESRQAAFMPIFGFSANQAFNFIIGHVIFSFGAPIAVAEAWRPRRALQAWLGPVGITIAGVAYVGTALMIALDPESQTASRPQFVASAVLAVACVLAAWLVGQRSKQPAKPDLAVNRPLLTFALALVPALVLASDILGESWQGFAFNLIIAAGIGGIILWRARRPGWGVADAAAVALAFLVSRGALAFTYFPLAGQVEPFAKYAHNVAMMTAVLMAGWFALRPQARRA